MVGQGDKTAGGDRTGADGSAEGGSCETGSRVGTTDGFQGVEQMGRLAPAHGRSQPCKRGGRRGPQGDKRKVGQVAKGDESALDSRTDPFKD